jgi:hypothetical protein
VQYETRSFDIDAILTCPLCGNTMRNISHIEQPQIIARILTHLGLEASPPPIAAARAPPQLELGFDDDDNDDPEHACSSWD